MAGETTFTFIGNIATDIELRFTPSGAAVANFRVANTPRKFNRDTNQWEDQEATFLTANVWRDLANHVAETLTKGMRVIIVGDLVQRTYQTREGENRTAYEINVREIGPSLQFATAQVHRVDRSAGGQGGQGGYGGQQGQQQPQQGQGDYNAQQGGFGSQGGYQHQNNQGGFSNQQQGGNDPWNSAPAQGQLASEEEPPF